MTSIRLILPLLICFISLAFSPATAPARTEPVQRPNVLFLAIDDLRPELASYGAKVQTPNLDRFARTAMQFDRAYCQQAVCGASRLSIMSGLYPTHTKEQTYHIKDWRSRHPDLLTLNQHFKANGYRTIGLGKIYHASSGKGVDEANWSQWIKVSAPGYVTPESKAARKENTEHNRGPLTELADVDDETYVDGQRAIKAAELLGQLAKDSDQSQPFFLAVGLTKPHLPFVAPKKYWDLYQRDQFKMPSNVGIPEGYPEQAAKLTAGEMQKYADYEGEMPTDFSDDLNKRLLHGYAACVSYMDANLGVIMKALQENGLAENTIVVFWGDHGYKLGDHSTWCKHTNFECDARVPLMVRAPESVAGQRLQQPVELIDLYPTLCELTGLKIPDHCQGKSFAGLLKDPTAKHRDTAYSSYPFSRDKIGHSIRTGDFRFTEWFNREEDGKSVGPRVLTNLVSDPGETKNLIDDPEHAETVEKAKRLLRQRIRAAIE